MVTGGCQLSRKAERECAPGSSFRVEDGEDGLTTTIPPTDQAPPWDLDALPLRVFPELVLSRVPELLLPVMDPVLVDRSIVASTVLRRDRQSAWEGVTAAASARNVAEQLRSLM
jgi:hypothetical protein